MSYHDVDFDYEDEGGIIDPVWLLAICIALGVWLVIQRYQSLLNRAIFFRIPPPPVRTAINGCRAFCAHALGSLNSKSRRHGPHRSCQSLELRPISTPMAYSPLYPSKVASILLHTTLPLRTIWIPFSPTPPSKSLRRLPTRMRHKRHGLKRPSMIAAVLCAVSRSGSSITRRHVRKSRAGTRARPVSCSEYRARIDVQTSIWPSVLDAALGEIITTCSKLDWLINHGERALSPEKRGNNLLMFYKSSYVYYEPLGVVSAIVSWNYRE